MQKSSLFSAFAVFVWRLFNRKGYDYVEALTHIWLKDIKDIKRAKRMHCEMLRDYLAYGALPEDYVFFEFETLNRVGKREYITDRSRYWLLFQVNSREDDYTFINKYKAYSKFKDLYKREVVFINSERDFPLFERFLCQHREAVVKRAELSRGRDVQLLRADECDIKDVFLQLISENDGHGYVLEEKIVQREEMARFNPSSVNTVRIPTLLTDKGVKIFNPVLRLGRVGSFVDNAAHGGILAAIDPESGIVYTAGRTERNETFVQHPDSKVIIPGYVIPEWENLVVTVKKAAMVVPTTRYVGWDMAYSDKGWVIVEGNNYGQPSILEIPRRKGCSREFETLMKISTFN